MMGSFIPTDSDLEICGILGKRFSNKRVNSSKPLTYLQQIQKHFGKESFLDDQHHLHRVFHRLATSVSKGKASVPSNKKSRLRWFFLLHKNLPAETDTALRSVLEKILNGSTGVEYVSFSTRPTSIDLKYEIYPKNSAEPFILYDADGVKYCQVILDCQDDSKLDDPPSGSENDPPDADQNVEQPFSAPGPRGRRKGGKKSTAKKSKKSKKSKKKSSR